MTDVGGGSSFSLSRRLRAPPLLTQVKGKFKISRSAISGPRSATVTNPDGGSGSLAGCFRVK